jgi:alanine-alpha-ketoisovalerate/valine-pyruvate aminotransferase
MMLHICSTVVPFPDITYKVFALTIGSDIVMCIPLEKVYLCVHHKVISMSLPKC